MTDRRTSRKSLVPLPAQNFQFLKLKMPSRSAVVVRNLPRQTTEVDVKRFFDTRLRNSDAKVFPLLQDTQHGAGTHLCTTVTLKSNWKKRALKLDSEEFMPAQGQEKSEIQIDATNIGPITLAEYNSPQFDAYFVHGLEGDAFTSWVCDETGHMWPRDSFPQHCLNLGVRGRFSTLGYDAKVLKSGEPGSIRSAAESLLTYIKADRPEGCKRPIFFICHSYGGITISQALILAFAKPAIKEEYQFIQHMVHGVVFFGTPFQGSGNADLMSPVATLVGSFTNRQSSHLSELRTNSKSLPTLSMGYNRIKTEENIETLVFIEKKKNGPSKTTRDSAILPFETDIAPIEIDANHIDMVKFASGTEARLPATAIANMIKRKLGLPTLPMSPREPAIPDIGVLSLPGLDQTGANNDENAGFSQLSQFDTVFVVDDTGSMQLQADSTETWTPRTKSRWDNLTRALQYIANIATVHDSDGLDVHFLISTKLNRKNVRTGEEILSLLKQVNLAKSVGGTYMNPPLAELLGPHIAKYQQHFDRKVAGEETTPPKPLNIIILTDGKADDQKALIRLLVRTAKQLDEMYAPDSQIGIQFLQVGDDKEAATFLKQLDNDLEDKYEIRDFIDTRTFKDQDESTDFTQTLREILLGAVNRSLDETT